MSYLNIKLWSLKVRKLDVCGRPLFANPVTYIEPASNALKHGYSYVAVKFTSHVALENKKFHLASLCEIHSISNAALCHGIYAKINFTAMYVCY